jgi:hypothetical protein
MQHQLIEISKAVRGVGEHPAWFSRFLANDAGLISQVSNYSASWNYGYFAGPPVGTRWYVHRAMLHIEDAGGFDATAYGNNITLANGFRFGIGQATISSGASIAVDLLDGQPIRTNSHWGRYCYDISNVVFGVGVNEFMQARWTFLKGGSPLQLDGDLYEKLILTPRDNLTELVDHNILIQGILARK